MASEPRNTRREFLLGKSAADQLAQWVSGTGEAAEAGELSSPSVLAADEGYTIKFSRPAMACEFALFLNAGQYDTGPEAALEALDLVERLEDQLSIFRPQSEVTRINRRAQTRQLEAAIEVEERLFELLMTAAEVHRRTHGAFDITTTPLTRAWRFDLRRPAFPEPEKLQEALAKVGMDALRLDPRNKTIRFDKEGMELNLGAIGKGYAIDRCAEILENARIADFLLQGGKSSLLARGTRGTASEIHRGWLIAVPDPLRPGVSLGMIRLRDRALGTSGIVSQSFRHQGKRYGHILDPRTGFPAEGLLSTTVLAPTGALADALATAFYILGVEGTKEVCREWPEVGAIMLYPGKNAGTVVLETINLSQEDWIPAGAETTA